MKEKVFALVELLIATAVSGLLVSVLGTAVYQMVSAVQYGGDSLTATHELQNVAYWVGFDGQRASGASGGGGLVLSLPDGSSITYSLAGSELRRVAGGSEMTVARNVSAASFAVEGRLITMNITSTPPGRWDVSEPGTYQVYLRAEAR